MLDSADDAHAAPLFEQDISPGDADDPAFWLDPDTGFPAELADLTDAGLSELLEAPAPHQPPVPGWPLSYRTPCLAAGETMSPTGFPPRDRTGGGTGFADGEVLDGLAAGLPLAGFADDAHARLAALTDDELIGVLRAWSRQASWAQARRLAAVAELARRRPADGTPPGLPGQFPSDISEFTGDEVALALTLAPRTGAAEVALALELARRLTATAAALEAGQIDLTKAKILAEILGGLTLDNARAVEAVVLPQAGGLTNGQLRRKLEKAVLAVDPAAERERRERAEKQARVECWIGPSGTANLEGRDLPAAATLAADKRVCQIAKAWKKQGATGGIDLLRARAYLALLLGQPTDTPPADLLPPAPGSHPRDGGSPHSDGGSDQHNGHGPGQHSGAGPDGDSGPGDDSGPGGQQVPAGLRRPGADTALPPLAGAILLTIPLDTMLGLRDAPGEAAGYGPLHGDIARDLARAAAAHPATDWGLIITDPDGRALGYGHATRRRTRTSRVLTPQQADGWTLTFTTQRIAGPPYIRPTGPAPPDTS